jgi:hypothetical protein
MPDLSLMVRVRIPFDVVLRQPGKPSLDGRSSLVENVDEVVELTAEPGKVRAVHLSKPSLDGYQLGDNAGFTLKTALMGYERVEIYEATSGTDRYPPGRIAKVSLTFAELDQLVTEYQKHRAALEEAEQARKASQRSAASASDDFDPFLDSDELP